MQQQYFTEQAENYEEAYRKVREKYGENVTVLLRKTVMIPGGFMGFFRKEGVEISGPIPQFRTGSSVANAGNSVANAGNSVANAINLNQLRAAGNSVANAGNSVANASVAFSHPVYKTVPAKEPLSSGTSSRKPLDFDKEKAKVLAAAGVKDPSIQMLMSELRTIRDKIDNQAKPQEEHPCLSHLDEVLLLSDFPHFYRMNILDRVKKEFPLDDLNDYDAVQDRVLEWIGKSISIYEDDKFHRRPRVIILVGPTGVGKTTTIAKLAANFSIDQHGKKIKEIILITIDCFRIGAKQQLETYGKILQAPCFAVDEYSELKKTIDINSDNADIILIDTIGKSPRDLEKLGQMKKLLEAAGQAEVHLTVSAATKSSDLEEILQQFEPFNYKSVIITKMDETARVGNIIGVLAEKRKQVSYITDGQTVPVDIRKATAIDFLINLEGFKVNRNKLESLFTDTQTEQLRLWS